MTDEFLQLTVHARHEERVGRRSHEDGEVHYTFYGNGAYLDKSTIDTATKRTLRDRLTTITYEASLDGWDEDRRSQLVDLGKRFFSLVFPDRVRQRVSGLDGSKSISLDVQDHDIPWELLHDGEGFLAERHAFGRKLIGRPAEPQSGRRAVRIVIVGDPNDNLEGARQESENVRDRCRAALAEAGSRHASSEIDLLQGPRATKGAVLVDRLMHETQEIDIFHFAGHAYLNPSAPEDSGLNLADGILRSYEARSLASTPLVFVNGCRAGQPTATSANYGDLTGFAREFANGGAVGYIAPAWPVSDSVARSFADAFYDSLIGGASIGGALLHAKRQTDDPDALAYVFYGGVSEQLPIFTPQLTSGPFVDDRGIQRIAEIERDFPALELLAVNDLPWILWDAEDIERWTARMQIDQLRKDEVAKSLLDYVDEFGTRVKAGEKRFFCLLNTNVLRDYIADRGPERWRTLAGELDDYIDLPNFTLLLATPQAKEIEEIELVSKSSEIPPAPLESVYVFNKQIRFEKSPLNYNLFEDCDPEMISYYWRHFERLIDDSLTDYQQPGDAPRFSEDFSLAVNRETRAMLESLVGDVFDADAVR